MDINTIPKSPGIYMMKDYQGNIIYVGKSKSLKDRVKSYFINSNNHSRKIKRMIKNIDDISIITTDTELDALILECEKIHEIRPMYNTLMKKYENYRYIKIDKEKLIIDVVSYIKDDRSIYFGPYSMDKKLEEIKMIIIDLFNLPNCKKYNKCIRYDLKQCIAPCRNKENIKEYKSLLNEVEDFINGKNRKYIDLLKVKMFEESKELNFEKANEIKVKLDLLDSIIKKQQIINQIHQKNLLICWIKINEYNYKIYLINYGKVLFSKVVDISKINDKIKEEINLSISKIVLKVKNKEVIDKSKIDYINIVYNYINKNEDINYIYINRRHYE